MKMPKKFSEKQTSFLQRVYRIVRKIPKGKVATYKEVARLAGSPLAFRAVGQALNKNPDLKAIPCHRVVKSDGLVGGYKYGTNKKTSLLKKEGVRIEGKKVVF
jgi:O-6-methylguanine DNA methyltransferase